MTTINQPKPMTGAVDWDRIAGRLAEIRAHMVHHEDTGLYGTAFEAEALRRALGYQPPNEHGIDRLHTGAGLTTESETTHLIESHTIVDRHNREKAEQQVAEMRAEVRRVYAEARKDIAASLRDWCNERTVPSRYRREGVQQVIDLLDPPARQADGGDQR